MSEHSKQLPGGGFLLFFAFSVQFYPLVPAQGSQQQDFYLSSSNPPHASNYYLFKEKAGEDAGLGKCRFGDYFGFPGLTAEAGFKQGH